MGEIVDIVVPGSYSPSDGSADATDVNALLFRK